MQNMRNAISDSSYQFGWPQLLPAAAPSCSQLRLTGDHAEQATEVFHQRTPGCFAQRQPLQQRCHVLRRCSGPAFHHLPSRPVQQFQIFCRHILSSYSVVVIGRKPLLLQRLLPLWTSGPGFPVRSCRSTGAKCREQNHGAMHQTGNRFVARVHSWRACLCIKRNSAEEACPNARQLGTEICRQVTSITAVLEFSGCETLSENLLIPDTNIRTKDCSECRPKPLHGSPTTAPPR